MFGLGYQELLIILVIVLILFGANRLPELANRSGRRSRRSRRASMRPKNRIRQPPARKAERRKPKQPSLSRRTDRIDLACASALSLLTVLSRLPYRARIPYNWDAVQFALALNEYDISKHQPHPPGYILYVALGHLVKAWLRDPTASYV